jgi:site-specific DNA-cytosine methylase
MTYGSFFTGIGGLDRGLDRAGLQCRFQVEIDPFCRKILAKHWPHVKRYGDIRTVNGRDLEPVDLLAGGFPCQDLSQAGTRAGIEGARSGLWFEFARIIGELRPRYVLVENVPGLLVYDGLRRVIGELSRFGYVGIWRSLRASEFGASHLRKRVFIVAYSERDGCDTAMGDPAHQLHNGSRYAGTGWRGEPPDADRALADTGNGLLPQPGRGQQGRDGAGPGSEALDDSHRTGLEGRNGHGPTEIQVPPFAAGLPQFAPGPSDPRWPYILRERPDLAPALAKIRRVADGLSSDLDRAMSDRTKRLGRLGNAVVPQVAEWLGQRILAIHHGL